MSAAEEFHLNADGKSQPLLPALGAPASPGLLPAEPLAPAAPASDATEVTGPAPPFDALVSEELFEPPVALLVAFLEPPAPPPTGSLEPPQLARTTTDAQNRTTREIMRNPMGFKVLWRCSGWQRGHALCSPRRGYPRPNRAPRDQNWSERPLVRSRSRALGRQDQRRGRVASGLAL